MDDRHHCAGFSAAVIRQTIDQELLMKTSRLARSILGVTLAAGAVAVGAGGHSNVG